jgi:hypothetical protein
MASSFHPHGRRVPAGAYYPGDDVIDWLAADGYNWFGCRSDTWRPFGDIFADFIAWAGTHRRPPMVAEWGSQEDPATPGRKGQWITAAGEAIHGWQQLRAILYWNATGRHGRCPFYLRSSLSAISAIRTLVGEQYFSATLAARP